MKSRIINLNGILTLRIESDQILIYDLTSAIQFLETILNETGLQYVIVDRNIFANDFFMFAISQIDYVLQLLHQYGIKLAVIGDYSDTDSYVIDTLNQPYNTSLFLVESEQNALKKINSFA